MTGVLRSIAPMIVLGSVRLFTIKSANYQEHITEYGVHWNFFFTLAAVALLSALLNACLALRWHTPMGAIVLIVYQVALNNGLTDWIQNAPRVDLISANKEGLCSCIGYFSLYLMAVPIGRILYRTVDNDRWSSLRDLLYLGGVLWIITWFSMSFVQPVSRQMANMSYVVWTLASNVLIVSSFLAFHLFSARRPAVQSLVVRGVNRNYLPTFLLANVMTGAVNVSMRTLFASPSVAYVVIGLYMVTLSGVAVVFDSLNWSLKFW